MTFAIGTLVKHDMTGREGEVKEVLPHATPLYLIWWKDGTASPAAAARLTVIGKKQRRVSTWGRDSEVSQKVRAALPTLLKEDVNQPLTASQILLSLGLITVEELEAAKKVEGMSRVLREATEDSRASFDGQSPAVLGSTAGYWMSRDPKEIAVYAETQKTAARARLTNAENLEGALANI